MNGNTYTKVKTILSDEIKFPVFDQPADVQSWLFL